MADKPAFDPSQPFDVVKPPFDPSQPFDAAPDGGSSAMGVAKSLGVGAAQGGIGLAGMPGDLATLAQKGASKLPDIPAPAPDSVLGRLAQFLKDESAKSTNLPAAQGSGDLPGSYIPPTSAQLQGSVEGATGPFYKPQGALEETAAKVGQFLPAMVGGPESFATKALTRVAAPAIASEAAGQATEGTAAQPYAELAGALAGGAGASAGLNKFNALIAARKAAAAIPSAADLLATGGNQFNQARDMNMVVKPGFVTNAASDMRTALKGFDPEAQGHVFRAADRLEALGNAPVEMNEVENIRKQLVSLKTSPDASTRAAAGKAISSLQDSQKALLPADVLSGDAGTYSQLIKDATGNYAAGKRSNTVMGKVALGNLNAETAGSGANVDNALRQAIKQLVRPVNNDIVPKAQRLGFNQPEIAALNTAARGTLMGNAARFVGKAAPTGIVPAAGDVVLGHMAAGPVGALALPAVGYFAKKIGDMSTKNAVSFVDNLVRSRSPLAQHIASQIPPKIVQRLNPKTQALLTAMVAIPQTIQQVGQAPGQTNPYEAR